MTRFTNLMFTDESRKFVLDLDEGSGRFGPSYGNHIANESALRERWKRGRQPPCSPAKVDVCASVGSG